MGEMSADAAESENLSMPQDSNRENREVPSVSQWAIDWERSANVSDGKADMHADGKSHESVVPTTTANNDAAEASADPPPVCARGRGKRLSQEERRTSRLAPDTGPDRTQVTRFARRTRSCPKGQQAQVHGLIAPRQQRLPDRSFLQLEEDGGGRSGWCNLA